MKYGAGFVLNFFFLAFFGEQIEANFLASLSGGILCNDRSTWKTFEGFMHLEKIFESDTS